MFTIPFFKSSKSQCSTHCKSGGPRAGGGVNGVSGWIMRRGPGVFGQAGRGRGTDAALLWVCLALAGVVVLSSACSGTLKLPPTRSAAAARQNKSVKVITRREGDVTHFYVRNDEYCEVTMTFNMALTNLKGDVPFPYTTAVPARQTTEVFSLSPVAPDAHWKYSYTNYYKLGSNRAQHDDSYVYLLPYAPGTRHTVTQGYNGKYSHTGSNRYAIDWQMPEGTAVYAARGGVVVRVKQDSDTGGASMTYDPYNNYVLIRHADGTLGHYCHLEKGGCVVKVGQRVMAGQLIAHSGNTGFSTGPHLHFCVFKTKNGRERVSIPVEFKTATAPAITLVSNHSYQAAPIQVAIAARPVRTPAKAGSAVGAGTQ